MTTHSNPPTPRSSLHVWEELEGGFLKCLRRITFWHWFPLTVLAFFLLIAPLLATHDPIFAESGRELDSPSADHWLGTDRLGRDEWSRLAIGGRRTLSSALLATTIAVIGGLALSSLSFTGSTIIHHLSAALTDALLAFPALLLALVVRTLLEGNLWTLAIAVGLANLGPYTRLATDALHVAQSAPHIEGAHSIGAGRWRILTRHIIPTALPTLVAFASVIFAWSLLYGAALAFIGLGGDPSHPDWGVMIEQAQGTLSQAPMLVLLPSGALATSVWLAHRFADALTNVTRM